MGVKTTDSAPIPSASLEGENPAPPPQSNLPVAIAVPATIPAARRRPWPLVATLLLVLIAVAGGGAYWWTHRQPLLPPGFAAGNGRLEADEIDIATKFAGRIAEVLADEGDVVTAGQVIARMDTKDLEAALKTAQAQANQAQKALD